MEYIELKLIAEREDANLLTAALETRVPGGFSVDDPRDYEELLRKEHDYDWDYVDSGVKPAEADRVVFTVWLEDTPDGLDLLDKVLSDAAYFGALESSVSSHSDEEWIDRWKAFFKPKKVGRTVVVKPTWEPYEAAEGETVVEIDPGRAFGTGTHETTSLCIRALEEYIPRVAEERGVAAPDVSVLDVGCGSGILSLVAAKLGVKRILGIEIDPVAVEVARENVARNGLSDAIVIREGDLTKDLAADARYDVVVANLMADLVIRLSADVRKH
ncbi:MAG: 50S ribosomal protein L11 methyltransferase, partial [Firmicutes bacterium]|nr:50S ribosomal protein L11 methyltransferase [Bacillota bacterium]